MGVEKTNIPARFDAPEVEHIDNVCFSRWPNLTRSQALRLIVMEHRLLTLAGILAYPDSARQREHCLQLVPSKVIDSSSGQGTEGMQKVATGGKSA